MNENAICGLKYKSHYQLTYFIGVVYGKIIQPSLFWLTPTWLKEKALIGRDVWKTNEMTIKLSFTTLKNCWK